MTDSPAPRIPLEPKEQPILDKLLSIRAQLELLKGDRSTYVKSQDVVDLYNQVIEQVVVLNELRTTKHLEQNRGILSSDTSSAGATANRYEQSTMYWTTVSSSYRLHS
jgi:hypothetical protein